MSGARSLETADALRLHIFSMLYQDRRPLAEFYERAMCLAPLIANLVIRDAIC